MDKQYFYAADGKRIGPIPFAALRELATKGELKRDSKVWCQGMKVWQHASSMPELFEDLPPELEAEADEAVPPPLPTGEPNIGTSTGAASAIPARKQRSPGLMALASLILPGLGQLISGQDAKGLFLILVSIAANFLTGGLSSVVLCPAMSIDAYGIAKKANTEGVRKWEFFPSIASVNRLAAHVVPAAIVTLVLLLLVVVKLEQKSQEDARVEQNQERFLDLLQSAQQQRGY